MDLLRTELVPPLIVADLQREARQRALADQAAPDEWTAAALAAHLGALLVRVGCRLTAASRGRTPAAQFLAATEPCCCGR